MRVAIYARVSTDDKGQEPENQLRQLRAWCASAGHDIAREYVDHASGRKGAEKRPEFAAMLADAHKRQFDLVLCWALDRLSREGMVPTVLHLQRLASYGVGFHSYTEPMLSTDNEMVRDIVLAVMASLAKIERQKISERTRAGSMRRTKGSGWGARGSLRPSMRESVEMLAQGDGIRATAKAVCTGNETVHRMRASCGRRWEPARRPGPKAHGQGARRLNARRWQPEQASDSAPQLVGTRQRPGGVGRRSDARVAAGAGAGLARQQRFPLQFRGAGMLRNLPLGGFTARRG